MEHGGPSWLAAVETIACAWLEEGDCAGARQALDAMRGSLERGSSSRLARATEAILRSWLLAATGEEGTRASAEAALAVLGDRAPWWRGKAIRALETAGGAAPALVREAEEIERHLGIRSR